MSTPKEVADRVRHYIEVGGKNGRFALLLCNLGATTPPENVKAALKALAVNPVKGKNVLIKPNFNTADPVPGSTHNDTLMALVDETWAMGAKSISLGERSYPPTREVMDKKK